MWKVALLLTLLLLGAGIMAMRRLLDPIAILCCHISATVAVQKDTVTRAAISPMKWQTTPTCSLMSWQTRWQILTSITTALLTATKLVTFAPRSSTCSQCHRRQETVQELLLLTIRRSCGPTPLALASKEKIGSIKSKLENIANTLTHRMKLKINCPELSNWCCRSTHANVLICTI